MFERTTAAGEPRRPIARAFEGTDADPTPAQWVLQLRPVCLLFVALLLALGFASARRGGLSESAVRLWADAVATQHLSAGEALSWRDLGSVLPHLVARVVALLPSARVQWLLWPSVLAGAAVFTLLAASARRRLSRGQVLLFLLAALTSPFLLQAGTDAGLRALSLLPLLGAYFALSRLERRPSVAGELAFAGSLAVFALAERGALYVLVGFGIVLPLLLRSYGSYPRRLLAAAALSAPAFCVWIATGALHGLALGDGVGRAFLTWLEPMHGLARLTGPSVWFQRFAGPDARALLALLALAILSTPALLVIAHALYERRRIRTAGILVAGLFVPLFAGYEANALQHSDDPWTWLAFMALAGLTWIARAPMSARTRTLVLSLTVVTNLAAWRLEPLWADPEHDRWRRALVTEVASPFEDARETAAYLSRFRNVLLDESAAFPVVAATSRPSTLLPIDRYESILEEPDVAFQPDAIVVMNPAGPLGARDRLNRVLPELWTEGLPGYRVGLSFAGWRVYVRDAGNRVSA